MAGHASYLGLTESLPGDLLGAQEGRLSTAGPQAILHHKVDSRAWRGAVKSVPEHAPYWLLPGGRWGAWAPTCSQLASAVGTRALGAREACRQLCCFLVGY